MRIALIIYLIIFSGVDVLAQNTLRVMVRDAQSLHALSPAAVRVMGTAIAATTGSGGEVALHGIPDGRYVIEASFVGYESQTITVDFPRDSSQVFELFLAKEDEELEEIVISSTRSSRTFADIPTRIEFIAGEELDEKGNMKPGDIRMLLNESTGIQTQQTSATSANASIRIQGLDGRYTQILKDGLPLYAGFSGGLGLLQTPPLDLKQVEVIKGSSSTLYGGGAIAGLVNLISRVPTEKRDLGFLINATSAGGLDLSGFYGEKLGKAGLTLFASRNSNAPYDPAGIDLTAIPKFERYSVNPRFFIDLDQNTALNFGFNYTTEDRIGGDIRFVKGRGDAVHSYFERNDSKRYSTQLSLTRGFSQGLSIHLKNSLNHFDRTLETPGYTFAAIQNSTFSEVTGVLKGERVEWIAGFNVWTDGFRESSISRDAARDYYQTTIGAFVQNTFTLSDGLTVETGLRGDYILDYGFVFLPRLSLLFKSGEKFTSRAGGGFGYKAPTIFTEESERLQFRNVLAISPEKNTLEKSYGANWDVNYRTEMGDFAFSVNHLFFYTRLKKPLTLNRRPEGDYEFVNLPGFTDSKGSETNVKLEAGVWKLFVGYTFTDARIHTGGLTMQHPLTAKHRLNNVLMYEVEDEWKIGLEAYYFSRQRLTDNTYGFDYWICGFMIEKLWARLSLFINFENFLDARQTRFDTIFTGTITEPTFRDIYAPVDGFVINGGLKLRL